MVADMALQPTLNNAPELPASSADAIQEVTEMVADMALQPTLSNAMELPAGDLSQVMLKTFITFQIAVLHVHNTVLEGLYISSLFSLKLLHGCEIKTAKASRKSSSKRAISL